MRRIIVLFFATVLMASAGPSDEIEGLLHFVAALDGASFVRNGSAHTPTEAEAHLRAKWNWQKKDISTAEDFIRLCGTQSSLSGTPYTIRFADGREVPAAKVLTDQLAVIRLAEPARTERPSQVPK